MLIDQDGVAVGIDEGEAGGAGGRLVRFALQRNIGFFLTVSIQSLQAALSDPVGRLRGE